MREFELNPEEHVVKEIRKHWFVFFVELVPYAILAALPFALPNVLSLMPTYDYASYFDYSVPGTRALLGTWLLMTWTAAWGIFTRYYLNLWVLTNERIVAIKQRHFFDHEVSSLLLTRVQDVTSNVSGVIASFLDIGEIKVQSAGTDTDFIMHGMPHPQILRELIMKYVPENDGVSISG
jgi:hypothetical protein